MRSISINQFEDKVLPLFNGIAPIQHHLNGNEAAIILGQKPMYVTFLTYIPKGTTTTFPTVEESLGGKSTESRMVRVSNGEWVVEKIYETKENQDVLLEKIKKGYLTKY